ADKEDMGFPNDVITRGPEDTRDRLESYAGIYPLKPPAQILAQTSPVNHNEVVLTGPTFHGAPVQIDGVYIYAGSEELPVAKELIDIAQWYGLPVVVLQPSA